MALRFCLHNRSPIETNVGTGKMDLNQEHNQALSMLINHQYLEEYPDRTRMYYIGGSLKLLALGVGDFGATFAHEDSPISTLVEGFYTALQPFYGKINRKEWDRRYAAYSNEDPSESEGTSLDALVPVNHDLLLDVFTKVVHSGAVGWNSMPPKTPDQFEALYDANSHTFMKLTTVVRQENDGSGSSSLRVDQ